MRTTIAAALAAAALAGGVAAAAPADAATHHHHVTPAVRIADELACWHQKPISLGVVPSTGVDCRTATHGRFLILHYRNFARARSSWAHWLDGGDWAARKRNVFVVPYEGNHPYGHDAAKWAAHRLAGHAFNGSCR